MVDGRKEHFDPSREVDCSYLEETADGIRMKRHPKAMLLDEPDLWSVVAMWRYGPNPELTLTEIRSLSAFDADCWTVMAAAHSRQMAKHIGPNHA